MPTGGRRSKPFPQPFSVSDTRFRGPLDRGAGLKAGGPWPGCPQNTQDNLVKTVR